MAGRTRNVPPAVRPDTPPSTAIGGARGTSAHQDVGSSPGRSPISPPSVRSSYGSSPTSPPWDASSPGPAPRPASGRLPDRRQVPRLDHHPDRFHQLGSGPHSRSCRLLSTFRTLLCATARSVPHLWSITQRLTRQRAAAAIAHASRASPSVSMWRRAVLLGGHGARSRFHPRTVRWWRGRGRRSGWCRPACTV
jgi:hypothetical protein